MGFDDKKDADSENEVDEDKVEEKRKKFKHTVESKIES